LVIVGRRHAFEFITILQNELPSQFSYSITGHLCFSFKSFTITLEARGGAVLEGLCYKPEGRGIDS
jgi:hypothetical protein